MKYKELAYKLFCDVSGFELTGEEGTKIIEQAFQEVAEQEREACAKIASSFGNRWDDETGFDNYVGEDVAKAIRARGES